MRLPWSKRPDDQAQAKSNGGGLRIPLPSPSFVASLGISPYATPTREQLQQEYERPPEFDLDYVNEEHIAAFERALNTSNDDPDEPAVEHIRSVSDFAPIKERVRRSRNGAAGGKVKSKKRRDVVREGWAYHVSRWPLLLLIFTLIGLEFLGYVVVRQLVNVLELFSGWRGKMGQLRLKLRRTKNYEDWKATALQLDELLGYTAWKKTPANAYYDSSLVRRVLENLREMREKDDVEGVCAVLEVCLRSNFAGIESFRLYSETYFGTKDRIRDYIEEVERSIEYVRKTPLLTWEEKSRLFRYITKNNGSTALCLSGGASFGYYHFGVVRSLLDANLLPKVITGTSAGALIAAFVCTHTDDELRRLIIPQLAQKITACEEPFSVWVRRWWRTGARFDTVEWARKACFFTNGTMTFKEAYERTGRVLNVSVIPYDTHSPTKLLNVHTAPDCVIFTAIIASAAVPGILNPVVLMTKDRHGRVKPWQFQGRHKDGSLRVDIPLQSLHLFFNVTYSIISQVNPHIHLFFFQPRGAPGKPVNHRKGKGWRGGFFLSAAEQFLKLDLTKNFRVIRDLELMPELMGQNWSGVFLQKFEGSVTIWPKSRVKDWIRILTDPDEKELARMIRVGQLVTWPKLHMIENRMRIERQIDAGRAECRAHLGAQQQNKASATSSMSSRRIPATTDSSAFEDSESDVDLDLGGPEGSAPVPRNDETLEEVTSTDERDQSRKNARQDTDCGEGEGDEEEDDEETQQDFAARKRRGASAPPSQPSSASRKRRRQILSSLGLSEDRSSPIPTPLSGSKFDFGTGRGGSALSGDEGASGTEGASSSLHAPRYGAKRLRRRLSTGQLWLGGKRSSNGPALQADMFGSGLSGEDDDSDENDAWREEKERSFEGN